MLHLLYTTGSPFARAVRIVLDEIGLDYGRHEEIAAPSAGGLAPPTLQVPTLWHGDLKLWESGIIAEYLLSTFSHRPAVEPPLAHEAFRSDALRRDKLVFSTIQTFGTAATTISQMRWTEVTLDANPYLERLAEKLTHILAWLDGQLGDLESGFQPGFLSIHDIFLAAHVRFVQARPLGIDISLQKYEKLASLLERLDARDSFKANPIWWWEPGIIGYEPDGTPVFEGGDRPA